MVGFISTHLNVQLVYKWDALRNCLYINSFLVNRIFQRLSKIIILLYSLKYSSILFPNKETKVFFDKMNNNRIKYLIRMLWLKMLLKKTQCRQPWIKSERKSNWDYVHCTFDENQTHLFECFFLLWCQNKISKMMNYA